MPAIPTSTGTVRFGDHRTWYRLTGGPGAGAPTVVVVHGGPGSTHDYLLNLRRLADGGWPVLHYDQLGNGGSTHLPAQEPGFWTVEMFLAELDNLIAMLDIGEYVLFGHSWGGVLAAAHAATRPAGLRGLVVADAPASYPMWRAEMKVLRDALPPGLDDILRSHEAAGTTDAKEYLEAVRVFYDRHVCRVSPWPRDYMATFMEIDNDPTVYHAMNGPTEFHVTGSLRDLSITDRLPDIAVPTLIVSGRHDEATPNAVRPYSDLIPDARWEIFESSSHVPHLEEPERFHTVLTEYLRGIR